MAFDARTGPISCPTGLAFGAFDSVSNVRQRGAMTTNVRTFLREFAAFKAKARRGGTVRIRDKEGEFIFTSAGGRQTLLGAAKGKIAFPADIVEPTLSAEAWKPSL